MALFIVLAVLRRPLRPRSSGSPSLLGLLQTTGMIGLLMWALQSGAAGRVSALVYTMPFWAMILGWALLGRAHRGLAWLAAAFSLAGLVLVLDPAHLGGSLQSKLLALGSGLCWALSAIVAKKIRARGPTDVINLTAWQMLYGSIPIIIIAVFVPLPAHRVDGRLHRRPGLQRHPRHGSGLGAVALRAAGAARPGWRASVRWRRR